MTHLTDPNSSTCSTTTPRGRRARHISTRAHAAARRRRVARGTHARRSSDVPEPSPLFWEHVLGACARRRARYRDCRTGRRMARLGENAWREMGVLRSAAHAGARRRCVGSDRSEQDCPRTACTPARRSPKRRRRRRLRLDSTRPQTPTDDAGVGARAHGRRRCRRGTMAPMDGIGDAARFRRDGSDGDSTTAERTELARLLEAELKQPGA